MGAEELRQRAPLRIVHLAVGVAGVVIFLITGQFMDRELDHLRGMADGPRALYRSGHIYILFTSLLNLVLGAYVIVSPSRIGRVVQALGSLFLLAALGLFVYGFYVETPLGQIERPMVRLGIVLSLWGALLHGVAGYAGRGSIQA